MHDPEGLPPDGRDRPVLGPGWRRTSGREGGRPLDWRRCSPGTPCVTAARAVRQFEGALAVGADDDMEALARKGLTPGVDDRGVTPEPMEPVRLLFRRDATSRWAGMLATIGAMFLVLEAGKPT